MLAFALSASMPLPTAFRRNLGDDALAAINIAYPLTAFLQATGTGIGMGGAIQYAWQKGTGKGGTEYFGMSLILLAFFGVFLAAVTFWPRLPSSCLRHLAVKSCPSDSNTFAMSLWALCLRLPEPVSFPYPQYGMCVPT